MMKTIKYLFQIIIFLAVITTIGVYFSGFTTFTDNQNANNKPSTCSMTFRVIPAQVTKIHIWRVSDNYYMYYCTTNSEGYCPSNCCTLTEGVEYRAVPDCGTFVDGYRFTACVQPYLTVYCY